MNIYLTKDVNSGNEIVYLVTGGSEGTNYAMSSTEVLTSGAKSWRVVGDLPIPLNKLSGVSLHNQIIMTGGNGGNVGNDDKSIVVSFNITSEQWEHVGNLAEKRQSHAASVVSFVDVIEYCSN